MKDKSFTLQLLFLFSIFLFSPVLLFADGNRLIVPALEITDQTYQIVPADSVMQKKGFLLFFMNPSGQPCQIQEKILFDNRVEIEKHYQIKLVKTTESGDRGLFYQFGVRSLPMIVLLKSNGSISQRFPPGIHSGQTILQVIQSQQ